MNAAIKYLFIVSLKAISFIPSSDSADRQRIKQRADSVLTLMSYMVVPVITASDLNIGTRKNESNELNITQFGGGATLSEHFPIYLEGAFGLQPLRSPVCLE